MKFQICYLFIGFQLWFQATLAAISRFEPANGGYYSASLKLQILLLKNLALYGRD
jgi:hypothetical protein